MMAPDSTAGIEREILGSILLRGDRYVDAGRVLTREHFSSHVNQLIWHAMDRLSGEGQPIDAISVAQWLIDRKRGDLISNGAIVTGYAGECIGTDPTHHVKKLHAMFLGREARRIGARLQESNGGQEAVDEAVRDLLALQQGSVSHEYAIGEAVALAVADMAEAEASDGDLRGITTGLQKVDEHLGGLQNSDLIIVGARPAMGKTSFLLGLAMSAGKRGVRMGLVSAEQPVVQIAQRHLASEGKVSLHDIRLGRVGGDNGKRLAAALPTVKGMKYWLYDRSGASIDDVVRVARAWKNKHGIDVLYLDYVQRIKGPGSSRVDQVGHVVRELKTLARDLNIPVVALAQVNRSVEARTNKRPAVSDLKDSGEIEQEADQILLIYRDEVYDEDSADKGIAEIIIGKNRHGYVGTVRTGWEPEYLRFRNFDPIHGLN